MSEDKKIILKTVILKVPIEREGDKIIPGVDYASYEIKKEEQIEMKSWVDLPNQSKKVSEFNQRQLKFVEEDETRDYILMKIIKK